MRKLTSIEEHFSFYSELGVAFTNWASVESALFWLFLGCLSKKEPIESSITFFSIENFRSKLQVTDELVKYKLKKTKRYKLLKDWSKLVERLHKASAVRNKLAHYQVRVNLATVEERRGKYTLGPNVQDAARAHIPGFIHNDLPRVRGKFGTLFVALRNFSARVSRQKLPYPTSYEQEESLQNIQPMIHEFRILPRS